jgi:hypothetical protein
MTFELESTKTTPIASGPAGSMRGILANLTADFEADGAGNRTSVQPDQSLVL